MNYEKDINGDLLRNAHGDTSFSPGVRAAQEKSRYINAMSRFEIDFFAAGGSSEQWAKIRERAAGKFNAYLGRRCGLASAAIVGPSKFPTERQRKKWDAAMRSSIDFEEWIERVIRSTRRRIQREEKREELKEEGYNAEIERQKKKLARLTENQEKMKEANAIIRKHKKNGIEAVCDALRAAKYPDKHILAMTTDRNWWGWGFAPYSLTNNRANMKRVEDRIKTLEAKQAIRDKQDEGQDKTAADFPGGRVVANTEVDRYQILFDEIPGPDIRKYLKTNGWRWSRYNKAWQRHLTGNGRYAVRQFLDFIKTA